MTANFSSRLISHLVLSFVVTLCLVDKISSLDASVNLSHRWIESLSFGDSKKSQVCRLIVVSNDWVPPFS
jgi:hypothetical protein